MIFVAQVRITQEMTEGKLTALSANGLIQMLNSAGRLEKVAIIDALLDRGEEAIPVLRETLLKGTPDQKVFTCRLLTEMRDAQAAGRLIKLTRSRDIRLSVNAINALRDLSVPEAAQATRRLSSWRSAKER